MYRLIFLSCYCYSFTFWLSRLHGLFVTHLLVNCCLGRNWCCRVIHNHPQVLHHVADDVLVIFYCCQCRSWYFTTFQIPKICLYKTLLLLKYTMWKCVPLLLGAVNITLWYFHTVRLVLLSSGEIIILG